MYLGLLIGICAAVLFYRAAEIERLSPFIWALSSVGVTLVISFLGGGLGTLVLGQVGLFVVMWLYNARKPGAIGR